MSLLNSTFYVRKVNQIEHSPRLCIFVAHLLFLFNTFVFHSCIKNEYFISNFVVDVNAEMFELRDGPRVGIQTCNDAITSQQSLNNSHY